MKYQLIIKKNSNINKVQQLIRNSEVGVGGRVMDQWLKTLVSFSEYLVQFPGPKGWRTSVCNSSSDVLFPLVVPGTVCGTHTPHAGRHLVTQNKSYCFLKEESLAV